MPLVAGPLLYFLLDTNIIRQMKIKYRPSQPGHEVTTGFCGVLRVLDGETIYTRTVPSAGPYNVAMVLCTLRD